MFTVEVRAGRLIEARLEALRNLERAVAHTNGFAQVLQRFSGNERMLARGSRPRVLDSDGQPVTVSKAVTGNRQIALE